MGGIVRLGLPASIGPYLLPAVLPSLHEKYPLLRLYVRENLPHALPEALAQGIHDLLIVPLPVRGEDFVNLRLFREPLLLAVPTDHRLASAPAVTVSDLEGEQVLTLERGHALHEQVTAICEECGAKLMRNYEGTSLPTLHQMVATGLGLTFLPGVYAKEAANPESGIRIVTLKDKPLHRTIGLLWRNTTPDTETFLKVAHHVREAVRQRFPSFVVLDA
jgi:LysR family hydrogen peroxide-inducible transcriptional activator